LLGLEDDVATLGAVDGCATEAQVFDAGGGFSGFDMNEALEKNENSLERRD
jgi:hypothetical protein